MSILKKLPAVQVKNYSIIDHFFFCYNLFTLKMLSFASKRVNSQKEVDRKGALREATSPISYFGRRVCEDALGEGAPDELLAPLDAHGKRPLERFGPGGLKP